MAVLRVAHVWGDRLLDVRHLAGAADRISLDGEVIDVVPGQRVVRGDTAYELSWVEPTPRAKASVADRDWRFAKLVACMVLLGSASVAMFALQVEYGFADRDDPMGRIGPVVLKQTFTPPPKPKATMLEATAKAEKTVAIPGIKAPQKALKAKDVGMLRALDQLGGAELLFAGGGYSPAVQNALNNLQGGPAHVNAQGLDMGPRNFGGPGGPGIGLGLGGPGFGLKRGPGGPPGAGLVHKGFGPPCCKDTKVSDGLSKDVVGKVIKRHFSAIKFCYEKELQQKPALNGKVLVQFVIDPAGAVSDATVAETTIEDANVETCILSQIRRWKFPEPNGGGVVSITHPWFFKPAGSED